MFSPKGQDTLSPFYVGPAIGIDGGDTVGRADAIGFESTQFEIYASPNGTIDGGQVTGFVGVRIKSAPVIGSLQLGSGTQPSNEPVIGIANPGAQTPILTVETSGNDINLIEYDPGNNSPTMRIGGGTPMLQDITIEGDVQIKAQVGTTSIRVKPSAVEIHVGGVVYTFDATGIKKGSTYYNNP